mmetsp:Transcript_19401/g.48317  ORF Transcript_19401/g.48317 Transcript_19401/m.48317 type:complete len:209 (+) Transcript_19401:280-906(+)
MFGLDGHKEPIAGKNVRRHVCGFLADSFRRIDIVAIFGPHFCVVMRSYIWFVPYQVIQFVVNSLVVGKIDSVACHGKVLGAGVRHSKHIQIDRVLRKIDHVVERPIFLANQDTFWLEKLGHVIDQSLVVLPHSKAVKNFHHQIDQNHVECSKVVFRWQKSQTLGGITKPPMNAFVLEFRLDSVVTEGIPQYRLINVHSNDQFHRFIPQ